MSLQVQLASIESSKDKRGRSRRKLFLETEAATPSADATSAVIRNLSDRGLLMETAADLSDGDVIEVNLPRAGAKSAMVIWSSERLYGCEFTESLTAGTVGAAILRGRFDPPGTGNETETGRERNSDLAGEQLSARARLWTIAGLALLCWSVLAGFGILVSRLV